ncbi:uncharacterized protein LOC116801257 [Drosophila sechellia]|uniref:uncharacterized protein LOC116801257 n=1 Tax=Drosophila sechellia TaxID=7238 RepID=UPI0013DE5551|nr:uncharacterized protein LOC116801257 [Drosophila sechellia]
MWTSGRMCNQAQMNHRSRAKKTSPDRRATIGSPMFLIRQGDKQPGIGSAEINAMHLNGADFGSYSCSKFNTLMDANGDWEGVSNNGWAFMRTVNLSRQLSKSMAIWLSIGGTPGNAHACQSS